MWRVDERNGNNIKEKKKNKQTNKIPINFSTYVVVLIFDLGISNHPEADYLVDAIEK